jgi:hypothetical protein
MGLIRKSLAVGTLGVVSPSSKKQRVAKATMKNTAAIKRSNAAIQQSSALSAEASVALLRQATTKDAAEHEFRYDTDAAYREWYDARQERLLAERAGADRQRHLALEHKRVTTNRNIANAVVVGVWFCFFPFILGAVVLVFATWGVQDVVAKRKGRQPGGHLLEIPAKWLWRQLLWRSEPRTLPGSPTTTGNSAVLP